MRIKPTEHSVCVECRKPIGDKPYLYTKSRGYPPTFIHQECWDKLPKCKGNIRNG